MGDCVREGKVEVVAEAVTDLLFAILLAFGDSAVQ
jgi:hypothetical protein